MKEKLKSKSDADLIAWLQYLIKGLPNSKELELISNRIQELIK